MLEALQEHFGGRATWTRPQGGLFIWVTLPEYIDTTGLLAQCEGSRSSRAAPRTWMGAAALPRCG